MNWTELELRWVLLGLGLLVILGVFLGGLIKSRSRASEAPRSEPEVWPEEPETPVAATEPIQPREGFAASIGGGTDSSGAVEEETLAGGDSREQPGEPEVAGASAGGRVETEGVVSLRLIPREGEELNAERTVRALREAGLQHGPYEIFHYCEDRNVPESGFSVANLVEPGSFEPHNSPESTLPGMTLFMVLPGSRDPVERFDKMIDIARELCESLDARLLDELGNSWSIQRERYLREELIEYRRRQTSI